MGTKTLHFVTSCLTCFYLYVIDSTNPAPGKPQRQVAHQMASASRDGAPHSKEHVQVCSSEEAQMQEGRQLSSWDGHVFPQLAAVRSHRLATSWCVRRTALDGS